MALPEGKTCIKHTLYKSEVYMNEQRTLHISMRLYMRNDILVRITHKNSRAPMFVGA